MLTSKDFAKNYAHFLTNIVRTVNRYDIPDYDALLIKLVGTRSNRDIVKKLFYWIPRSVRADGMIYKSSVELAHEAGVSKGTVDRAKDILELIGFDRQIKRANGSPTAHYALDMHRFLVAIARVLGVNWLEVEAWMMATNSNSTKCVNTQNASNAQRVTEVQDGDDTQNWEMLFDTLLNSNLEEWVKVKVQNHKDHFLKMRKSITHTTPSTYTTLVQTVDYTQPPPAPARSSSLPSAPVSVLQEEEKIAAYLKTTPANVKAWVKRHTIERVKAVVEAAEKDHRILNKGAWVRRALENKYVLEDEAPTYDVSEPLKALSSGMRMS